MSRLFFILSIFSFCLFSTAAIAGMSSFVADAVQASPGQETRRGKLYVSPIGTRFEYTAQKQSAIQIIKPSQGLFWLLFPKTKTYFEIKSVPSHTLPVGKVRVPCKPTNDMECRNEGDVKSGTMTLQRWVIGDKKVGNLVKVWWDPKRGMYIRQVFPDGSKMVAKMSGMRQFEGRSVEQWTMVLSLASGARQYSYMLFAPDLGFPVMEQGSTGLVKELHNIKPYAQDAALYQIPLGYNKIQTVLKPQK